MPISAARSQTPRRHPSCYLEWAFIISLAILSSIPPGARERAASLRHSPDCDAGPPIESARRAAPVVFRASFKMRADDTPIR